MPFWNQAPVVRLLLPLLTGIILWQYLQIDLSGKGVFCIIFLFALAIYLFRFALPAYRHRYINGLIINLLLIFAGYEFSSRTLATSSSSHFSNLKSENSFFQIRLLEDPIVRSSGWMKFSVEVEKIIDSCGSRETSGKILCYLQGDSTAPPPHYGDIAIIPAKVDYIRNAGNPEEFDYKSYLNRKGLYHQIFLKSAEFYRTGKNTANPLFKSAWQLRDYFAHCYFNSGLNQENAGIIQALVLGNKTDVDAEILATFSQTGAMHLLAVSGLHVGIIYMVISTLIGFPRRYKKRKILAAIPVIAALWLYAMITGLSGSVMRASLMFTVMIIGQALNRKPPTYNTIAAAAFILLVADPMLLFDTGFQLSFAAVVGIVSIQPLFSELWQPAIKPMKWAYSLVSVSMAAQIATFPLGIFYFHQFPNYFLLTNLLVLPVATVLVYLGLLLPLTHGIEPFAGWISTTTDGIIQALRFMVDTTASLPFSSTGGIFISSLSVFLLYALIIGSFQFIISRKFRWIPFVLISVIVIAGKVKFQPNNQSPYQFVAYNARGKTIIELFDNQQSIVITDSDTSSLEYLSGTYHRMHRIHVSDIIHPDTIAKGLIETGNLKAYHGFLSFAGKRILMANRCNRYEIEHRVGSGECIDALVVTDNRMIPPDRLLEAVQAGFVLLSSTIQNPDLISEWQTSCELRKIPIWVCALNGAFCYRNTQ